MLTLLDGQKMTRSNPRPVLRPGATFLAGALNKAEYDVFQSSPGFEAGRYLELSETLKQALTVPILARF